MKQWKLILVTLLAVLMVCVCTSAVAEVCADGCTQGTVYTTRPTCTEEGVLALVKCTTKGCDNYNVPIESWPVAAFGHDWKKVNITKPTCTEQGYDTYKCDDCGETKKENYVPATGHNFAGGTFQDIKQAATCVATGTALYKCADCDVVGEVTIPVNSGAHKQVTVPAKTPTCVAAGNELYYKCELCGVKLGGGLENLPIVPTAHNWSTVPAKNNSCTEAGYNSYDKCTLCGKIATADGQVPVTQPYGHKWNETSSKYIAPTCSKEGTKFFKCDHCGEKKEETVAIDPNAHTPNTVPAKLNSCTEDGYNAYDKCVDCGKVTSHNGVIPVTPAYGHKYEAVDWKVKPTCVAGGIMYKRCAHCKDLIEVDMPAIADNHQTKNVPVKHNSCTEAGHTAYTVCELCGKTWGYEETKPYGHNWIDSSVVKPATCTAPGVMKQRCTHCNATQEVEIKQLPHKEVLDTNLSYASTCETDGLNYWVCTTCDEYTREEVLPKSNHVMRLHQIFAPDCENHGYELWVCQYGCDHTEERRTVDALGHAWKYITTVAPTCKAEGYDWFVCQRTSCKYNAGHADNFTAKIDHKYTVKDAIKAPTCENEGFTWYYCEYKCGERIKKDIKAATGHNYFLVENVEPTCQAEGVQTYKCPNKDCETVYKTVKVEKLAHAYAESKWTAVVAPTCTETGREKNICIMCEDKAPIYRDVPALGHKMGKPTAYADKAPTCTEAGEGWIKCERCSLEENVVINATGHDMKETKLVDATCTKQGLIKLTCRNKCGLTEYEFIPATGHQNVTVVAETAPTCTENGSLTKQCADCDTVFTEPVPATGHKYVEVEAAKPTCTEGDYAVLKCSVCGDTKDGDYAEATGHNFQPWTEAAPTCTEGAYAVEKCVACGETRNGAYAEATGHNYVEVEAAAPTCTEGDYAVLKCSVCGDTKDGDYAEATGHNYVQVEAAAPTCTEGDYAVLECTVCGATTDGDYAAATGHEYEWVMNVVVPTPAQPGENHYKCKKCGDVAEVEYVKYTKYYYHNTVTSFGPTTEEIVGGDDWYRVTPIDLSVDGIYVYDLIASNDYVVGTVTVTVSEGVMTVSYEISARYFEVEEEALMLYASKADLAESKAVTVAFGEEINLAELFGEDSKIIVSLKLIATYDAAAHGVFGFEADAEEIADMLALID